MPTLTANFKVTVDGNPIVEVNELRKHLITWAQNQATGQRVQASLASRQFVINEHKVKAESYEFVVKYLEGMEIKE